VPVHALSAAGFVAGQLVPTTGAPAVPPVRPPKPVRPPNPVRPPIPLAPPMAPVAPAPPDVPPRHVHMPPPPVRAQVQRMSPYVQLVCVRVGIQELALAGADAGQTAPFIAPPTLPEAPPLEEPVPAVDAPALLEPPAASVSSSLEPPHEAVNAKPAQSTKPMAYLRAFMSPVRDPAEPGSCVSCLCLGVVRAERDISNSAALRVQRQIAGFVVGEALGVLRQVAPGLGGGGGHPA
jgi:hypothetical protein